MGGDPADHRPCGHPGGAADPARMITYATDENVHWGRWTAVV